MTLSPDAHEGVQFGPDHFIPVAPLGPTAAPATRRPTLHCRSYGGRLQGSPGTYSRTQSEQDGGGM